MSSDVTDVKINMALYYLIDIGAVPQLSEKLCVNVLLPEFKRLYKIFFVKILIERNVNISTDVYERVNYNGSLAKFT